MLNEEPVRYKEYLPGWEVTDTWELRRKLLVSCLHRKYKILHLPLPMALLPLFYGMKM